MTVNADTERFRSEADKYAAYLETPEGRLRLELAFANLQEFLPTPSVRRSLRALDLGCGTGANGLRLARLGFHVTLADSSPAMLDIVSRAARDTGIMERITLKHGNADQFETLFRGESFDVILCHNVLEFVDDPVTVLRSAAQALNDPAAVLSLLVRNRAGEVCKAALLLGDLPMAEHNLTAEWAQEGLYGGRVRLFAPESLQAMLAEASLAATAERGVRVLSDYLPASVSRSNEYERIFALERKLGSRPEFAAVARYTHCLAHRAGPVLKGGA